MFERAATKQKRQNHNKQNNQTHPPNRLRRVSRCTFFSHEYGRRVGMVPRSSLKEGKYNYGGEKDKDNPTTDQTKPTTAHRPRLHHQVVFPLYWGETSETLIADICGPEFTKEERGSDCLCSSEISTKSPNELHFSFAGKGAKVSLPRRKVISAPFGTRGAKTGCAPTLRNAVSL